MKVIHKARNIKRILRGIETNLQNLKNYVMF